MMLFAELQQLPNVLMGSVFLIGLLVGSFLNVVIYRLPGMMQRQWRKECEAYLELSVTPDQDVFNLMWPGSHCPSCQTAIKAIENIPVISYLLLGGKCGHCGVAISRRYPLVEALTGLCSLLVAWHFGYSSQLLFALLLTWCLIALSFIDADQMLLPDAITLPMLWLGLGLGTVGMFTECHASIYGAIAGYLALWVVYHLFKWLTGKEGMGYGDFKLLAMLGAWLGWQYLPFILFLATLLSTVSGISLMLSKKQCLSVPIPFGPFLAIAGWLAMFYGETANQWYFLHIWQSLRLL